MPNIAETDNGNETLPQIALQSENAAEGATIVFESLKKGEKADAENLLADDNQCWTAQAPNHSPADGCEDANNSYVELQLSQPSEINTAVIEESGNPLLIRLQILHRNIILTV